MRDIDRWLDLQNSAVLIKYKITIMQCNMISIYLWLHVIMDNRAHYYPWCNVEVAAVVILEVWNPCMDHWYRLTTQYLIVSSYVLTQLKPNS